MAVDRTRLNPIDDRPVNDIELSEQEILNKSFDRDYNVLANEILVLGADNRLKRQGVIATESTLQEISNKTIDLDSYAYFGTAEDATFHYIGRQDRDGRWVILRINKTTRDGLYANGVSGMVTAWANRATQTYREYAEAF